MNLLKCFKTFKLIHYYYGAGIKEVFAQEG